MAAIEKAIVIGGGIGGLTIAHALGRQGVKVRVIEIGDPSQRLGTGITLLGNALRALEALGLVADCLDGGKGWDKITMRAPDGQMVAEQTSPRVWHQDQPGALGIMRPVLGDILERHARKSGAQIDFNTHLTAIEQDADGVTVTLSNGETDRADLLIAADGVYSKTRSMVFGEHHKPEYAGQGVWRYTVPHHEAFDGLTLYRSPTGTAVGSLPLSDDLCYLFFLENSEERPRFDASAGPAHIRRLLEPYSAEELVSARDAVSTERHISYRPFDILLMENTWHKGRVVLLGDSAHSLTPQMTSGGGMAIEDALVLSQELSTTDDYDTALNAYFERRYPRVKKVFDVGYAICAEEQQPKHGREYAMGLLQEGHRFLAGPA